MKRVITYGTFDLTHIGHIRLLKRARSLGDYLIVGLSTDEFNLIKGKKSIFPYEHRKEILESMRFVDLVIPEHDWKQKSQNIINYNADIFVMGDDWYGKFDDLNTLCQVQYLARTSDISTTEIRNIIQSIKYDQLQQQCMNKTKELEDVYNSKSWKFIAPLRKLINYLK